MTEENKIEENQNPEQEVAAEEQAPPKVLSPAAQRALAEAEERREAAKRAQLPKAKEYGGPAGEEPTRFGDWEKKGIAYDF